MASDGRKTPRHPRPGTISVLQLPARDVREPSSPKEKLFRDKHAVFPKIRAQTIAKNWDLVKGIKVVSRGPRSLSWTGAPDPVYRFGNILNSITDMNDRMKEAAEMGLLQYDRNHELQQRLQHWEEVATQLKLELEEQTMKLHKMEDRYRFQEHTIEDLTQLVQVTETNAAAHAQQDEALHNYTIEEFLKATLGGEATGDVGTNFKLYRARLERERKKREMTIAQLTDSRSVVMEQKEQVEKQCQQLQSRLKRIADLEDRNRALERTVSDLQEEVNVGKVDTNYKLQHARREIAMLQSQLAERSAEVDDLRARLEQTMDERKRDRLSSDATTAQLRGEVTDLQMQLNRVNNNAKIAFTRGLKRSTLDLMDDKSSEEKNRLESELQQLEQIEQARIAEQTEFRTRVEELKKQNDSLQDHVGKLTVENASVRSEVAQVKKDNHGLITRLADIREQAHRLEQDLAAEKAKNEQLQAQRDRETKEKADLEVRLQELEADLKVMEEDAARFEQLHKEKRDLEVRLMMAQEKEKNSKRFGDDMRQRDQEMRDMKKKLTEAQDEMRRLLDRYDLIEKDDQKKTVERDQLWQKVTALLAEKAKKDQELQELQRELFKLKAMTEEIDNLKNAKTRYKEIGRKMLDAMKQMEIDMKALSKKVEDAERERRKLQRKNDELEKELEMREQQMNKLMRLCITGTIKDA